MGAHRNYLWWRIYTTVVKIAVWEGIFSLFLAAKKHIGKGHRHGSKGAWKL